MFLKFFFLSHLFLFDLMELVPFNELDLFDDESDNDGYGSGSAVTCAFPFFSDEFVGRGSGVGYGVFVPTGIDSIGEVVPLVVFVPNGVESKGGRLIEMFCC